MLEKYSSSLDVKCYFIFHIPKWCNKNKERARRKDKEYKKKKKEKMKEKKKQKKHYLTWLAHTADGAVSTAAASSSLGTAASVEVSMADSPSLQDGSLAALIFSPCAMNDAHDKCS